MAVTLQKVTSRLEENAAPYPKGKGKAVGPVRPSLRALGPSTRGKTMESPEYDENKLHPSRAKQKYLEGKGGGKGKGGKPLDPSAHIVWPDWVKHMSPEHRAEYFREHPNSKYAP